MSALLYEDDDVTGHVMANYFRSAVVIDVRKACTRTSCAGGVGTLMQTVPPDFVMFHNFKDQIGCITFTVQKNVMTMLAEMATAYPSSPPSL